MLRTIGRAIDDRFHAVGYARRAARQAFPDHWSFFLGEAVIALHALRVFFTGAFRRCREVNWLIGTTMFMLFFFGGPYPGTSFLSRLYLVHVLLPGLILALVTAHLMILWHQGHTQWPGKREREHVEVGAKMYPVFMMKTTALFFFTFAILAVLGTVAQLNSVWLYGPLRLMPSLETLLDGHTLAWDVFIPAVPACWPIRSSNGGSPATAARTTCWTARATTRPGLLWAWPSSSARGSSRYPAATT